MKKYNDLFCFCVGVILAAAGVIVWQSRPASAATQSYNETYTVSKWRNLNLSSTGGSTADKILSLGPAEWTVSGSLGSTAYAETWKVKTWRNLCQVYSGSAFTCSPSTTFTDSETYNTQKGYLLNHQDWGAAIRSGVYTALINDSNTRLPYATVSSLPTVWEVTGTINTP